MVAGLLILLILILGKAILTAITRKSAEGISNFRENRRRKREEREEIERAWEEPLPGRENRYGEIPGYSENEDEEDLDGLDEYFFDDEEGNDDELRLINPGRRKRPDSASRRRKKKEAGRSFIDSLMRRGMGLDISRIEETPEYQELKESYGMSDYEMGELISDALKEKQGQSSSEHSADGAIDTAGQDNEPVDLVQRELDRKFGDTGSVQVINLRDHSRITRENASGYFIDEDPDDPDYAGYPDTEELNEELKKQVASFYDDEKSDGALSAAGKSDGVLHADKKNEGSSPADEKKSMEAGSGNNFNSDGSIPQNGGLRADAARENTRTGSDSSNASEGSAAAGHVNNGNTKAASSENKADREASGAVGFNSPEQIKAEMERAEELRKNPPYEFPPIDLLKKGDRAKGADPNELNEMVHKLQNTLESFGVRVRVGDATCGPTVTRYEIYPEQGVKVKNITALVDDIKLALAVQDVRIESPIPGKAAVGIEVPNKTTTPVSLRELIDSEEFRGMQSKLTCAIGKDIGGKIICSDIASMPHALVAGSTGSGKSVCINAMILSILYKAKPSEVRLILIDPKRVELVGYNGIPHLLVPVVTDVKKATAALNWAVAEMDDRYNRFADAGVNNLASYNRLMEEKYYDEGGTEEECPDRLPQILIIIDEFCDLMMTGNPKEVEAAVGRLTQLARAAGIHLVIATQRPAVNVITGTIKANIPTRISFSLTSLVDSRTILDQAGAEKLLGKGDMLFSPQGISNPVRLQGAFVSDKEIAAVVAFIKEQCKQNMYNEAVSKHIEAGAAGDGKASGQAEQGSAGADIQNDRDEYFAEAGKLIIKNKKASIGAIQRAYRVGFNRAARIMDQLAEDGVVGPEEGTKPRRILMTMEQFEAFLAGENTDEDYDAPEVPEVPEESGDPPSES
ncbi:MAG: DNA translocase FtsK [Lachnospiraceae bacterium]|nr:DNA translocase FtsK [Lachnospiraceae bacterium]